MNDEHFFNHPLCIKYRFLSETRIGHYSGTLILGFPLQLGAVLVLLVCGQWLPLHSALCLFLFFFFLIIFFYHTIRQQGKYWN